MQFTQEDSSTRRVGVQEDLIKFRPSPNFKNMKKFLKNRNSYTETFGSRQPLVEQNVPRQPSPTPQPQPPLKPELKAEVKPVVVQPAVVQPPLPPYPPPPDSPPNPNIVIKQEREEENETFNNGERRPSPSLNQTEQEVATERPQKSKKTMCKEFIRGDCKRSVCRYSHELDLAQLPGVFTFCWNYQNTKCTYPYCKFVHASVWEEAEFYRTGILPPHARSHMKKAQPPPPTNDGAGPSNYVAANQHPTPMHPGPGMEKPIGVISCVPACSMEQRPMDFPSTSNSSNTPKREWNELDEFSSSPRDLEPDHLAKKCKNCEFLEFRVQYHKEIVDRMIHARENMDKKTAHLNKKSNKLSLVLLTLMKPGNNLNAGGVSSAAASGDKEKAMLEQLGHFISTSNRLSGPSEREESIKNTYGGSAISSLMAKIFCGNAEQPLTVDHSRET